MKKRILIMLFLIFAVAQIQASTNDLYPKKDDKNKKFHNFYFGPDLFWLSLNVNFQPSQSIKTNGYYAGLRIRYEYLRSKYPYFGADLFGSWGLERTIYTFDGVELFDYKETSGFGNFDLRLGYPFIFEDSSIIPFLGLGEYFTFNIGSHYLTHLGYFYCSGGYRFKFDICQSFSIGQNSKLFKVLASTLRARSSAFIAQRHYHSGGIEVSLPLIWSLDHNWTFQIEPYYLRFHFSTNHNILGSRFLLGYHF